MGKEELLEKLHAAREEMERRKQHVAESEAEVDQLETQLCDELAAENLRTATFGGLWFTRVERQSWRLPDENRDHVLALLEASEPGAVKKGVHPATLSKIASSPGREAWRSELRTMLLCAVKHTIATTKTRPRS